MREISHLLISENDTVFFFFYHDGCVDTHSSVDSNQISLSLPGLFQIQLPGLVIYWAGFRVSGIVPVQVFSLLKLKSCVEVVNTVSFFFTIACRRIVFWCLHYATGLMLCTTAAVVSFEACCQFWFVV